MNKKYLVFAIYTSDDGDIFDLSREFTHTGNLEVKDFVHNIVYFMNHEAKYEMNEVPYVLYVVENGDESPDAHIFYHKQLHRFMNL